MSTMTETGLPPGFELPPLPDHPVGRYALFSRLRREGSSAERIASLYHLPLLTVERYFGLDRVEPILLALYRTGSLTLGQIHVFSWIDDKAVQMAIYRLLPRDDKGVENILALLRKNFNVTPKA